MLLQFNVALLAVSTIAIDLWQITLPHKGLIIERRTVARRLSPVTEWRMADLHLFFSDWRPWRL